MKKLDQIAQLQRKNRELEAQLVHQHHFASIELDKLNTDHMMGSAVILELTFLGGKVIGPVAIKDGLSLETIKALKADLVRSYEKTVEFKP